MIGRTRRRPRPVLSPESRIELAIKDARTRSYADGLKDGARNTLLILVADPLADVPTGFLGYPGPIPDNVRAWALAAIERLEERR